MEPWQRLSFTIGQVAAEIADRGAAAVADLGLNGRSLGVLMVLVDRGPLSQQQMSDLLGIDRTTMVSVVDDLEAAGRVVRRRAPDRRGNQVTITEDGAAALADADAALQHCEEEFTRELSAGERGELMRLLGMLPTKDALLPPAGRPPSRGRERKALSRRAAAFSGR